MIYDFSYYYYIKFCFSSFYSYYCLEIKSYDIWHLIMSNKNICVCVYVIIGKFYYLKFEGQNITSEHTTNFQLLATLYRSI